MTEWIEPVLHPNQCRFEWASRIDHDGEHWHRCDEEDGHGGTHRCGLSWVAVGFEDAVDAVKHRWAEQ